MFKLNQARSEGWSLALDPIRIISIDPSATDLAARSAVFNQIMAGSAYHIQAFQIVTAQDAGAIALVPDVKINGWARITKVVTVNEPVTTQVPNPDYGPDRLSDDVPPYIEAVEDTEVTKPVGSVAKVIRRGANPASITIQFPSGGDATYDENDDDWFPLEPIDVMSVVGSYGILTVDKKTGAVLHYEPSPDANDTDNYADVVLIDVAELRSTFGELPDYIDIVLTGETRRDGTRYPPERDDWIKVRLDQLEDKTLAAILRARYGFTD